MFGLDELIAELLIIAESGDRTDANVNIISNGLENIANFVTIADSQIQNEVHVAIVRLNYRGKIMQMLLFVSAVTCSDC